jgi:phage terminase large subunit
MEIEFLEKLEFLFQPARLKIAYGGRGGGKTDGYAIALIILAMKMKLRILCLREIQTSIEESVKETIESYIIHYGLADQFIIKDKSITCIRTGSRFIFSGLRYKINSIKSLAKIDIAWVEEANNVSATSWDKLMPTIRGKHESDPNGMGGPFRMGPEVWLTFNPELDDDETYKRFVLNRETYAPDFMLNEKTGEQERYAYVVKINYTDNKWFPYDLQREVNLMKQKNYVKYLEIYEGNTKQTLDGAVYAEEILQTLQDGRRKHVPYDPSKPVITAWDLGHSDKTAIWFIQRAGTDYNIIDYYENRLKKLPHYIEVLQDKKYNYSVHYQPHDADNETLANRSIASMTRKAFPNAKVIVVQRPSKKAVGINAARTIFELCNFDEKNTADGWQCLSRYAFKVNEETGSFSREPDHDTPWSHGADAFQTFALSLKTETDTKKKITGPPPNKFNRNQPRGWMGHL